MSGIFLNYRRADTGHIAARIFERMRVAFPQSKIFMDIEEIPIGVKFADHINAALSDCEVTLVIIGPQWHRVSRGIWPLRRPRLHLGNDLVRLEIEYSLRRKVGIVPVLVDTSTPPAATLPKTLREVVDYQAFNLRSPEFRRDVEELVHRISKLLGLDRAPQDVRPRLARVKEHKVVRVGCIKHPPLCNFEWVDKESAVFSGLYVEMCRDVCAAAGLTPHFVPVDWADIPHRVFREMNLDMVLSVFQTPERARVNNFTACFHKVNIVGLVQKGQDKIRSLQDLRGGDCKVVVTKGEAGWEFALHNLQLPRQRLIVVESFDLTTMMGFVETGAADIAICDEVTCAEFERQSTTVSRIFANDPLDLCKNCVMVPPQEDDWRAFVGEAFERVRATPRIEALENEILAQPNLFVRRYS